MVARSPPSSRPVDFGLESVSTAWLASVEDARVAVSYFGVRVENQAAASTRWW